MKDTIGVVELDSARQVMGLSAGRLATRRIGGQNLLTWIVRRMSDAELLDRVIVVSNYAPLPSLPSDVEVFYSDADPLARVADAVAHCGAYGFLCVRLVHPWIDPDLLDRLVAEAYSQRTVDLVGYRPRDDDPLSASQLSCGMAWYRGQALLRANDLQRQAGQVVDVGCVLSARESGFQTRMLPLPASLDRQDVRLTVDCAEDWEHVESIYDALGPELSWQDIADLLDCQPQLRARMASLNRAAAV